MRRLHLFASPECHTRVQNARARESAPARWTPWTHPPEPVSVLLEPRSFSDSDLILTTSSIKAANELASPVNFIGKLLMPFRRALTLHNSWMHQSFCSRHNAAVGTNELDTLWTIRGCSDSSTAALFSHVIGSPLTQISISKYCSDFQI